MSAREDLREAIDLLERDLAGGFRAPDQKGLARLRQLCKRFSVRRETNDLRRLRARLEETPARR